MSTPATGASESQGGAPASGVPDVPIAPSSSAPGGDPTRDLAATIVAATAPQDFMQGMKGVVVGVTLPTISVTLSGDTTTTVSNVVALDSYTPVVGDTVLLAKQGTDVFALGQLNDAVNGTTANGWITPTLGTNVAHNGNSQGTLQYRLVIDNGDSKIQWKGGVGITSGATELVSALPTSVRPSVKRTILACRDSIGTGAVQTVSIDFNLDGTVNLAADNVSSSTNYASLGGSESGSTDTWGGGWGQSGSGGTDGHTHALSTNAHGHGQSGTVYIGDHNHSMATTSATWVSLNGLEYFL